MRTINILAIQRLNSTDRARIEAVDPAVRLTDAGGWFDGEIRDTWSAYAGARYLAPGATGAGTRAERDRLLAEAEVILGGFPFPLDLRARAPRLKWFHQRPAGASNLRIGDLWGSDVTVTTSRGVGSTLAMAEYAIAGILHFAKELGPRHQRPRDGHVRPSRLPAAAAGRQDRCAWSAPAGSVARSVGSAPRSACASIGTRRRPEPDAPLPTGFARTRRHRRSRPVSRRERLRGGLLPVDAGDHRT